MVMDKNESKKLTESSDLRGIEISELKGKFERCVNQLCIRDSLLLKLDVSERAIAHKLAEYLQCEFPDWNVDCEYNRMTDSVKIRSTTKRPFTPDIIVHRRNNVDNLIIIEIKKSGRRKNNEIQRLQEALKYPFNYKLGIYVMFCTSKSYETRPTIKYIY